MEKQSKKLWLTIEKTIKKKLIDCQKKIDNQKTKTKKSQLWKITLFENQPIENQLKNDFEKMIFENQKNDLQKIKNQKQKTLIDYWLEKIFFDLFLKNQLVNKKILKKDIEKQVFILSKRFLIDFDILDNKNISEKNYEKKLIEKISNKMIIDYIKKSDKKDFYVVKNLLEKINQLKNQLKITWIEKIDFYNSLIKNMKKQSNIKMSSKLWKSIKKQVKKDIDFSIENYHKLYEKYFQKKLKSSKRLSKKYWFLIDDNFFVNSQKIVNQ